MLKIVIVYVLDTIGGWHRLESHWMEPIRVATKSIRMDMIDWPTTRVGDCWGSPQGRFID